MERNIAENPKTNINISLIILIITNLLPFLGIIFLDRNRSEIFFSYRVESAIIGCFTILKMLKAEQMGDLKMNDKPATSKKEVIIFFMFHFGGFMIAHLRFLSDFSFISWNHDYGTISGRVLFIFFISFIISHGGSFLFNFIGEKEYKRKTVGELMFSPYKRIGPMHMAIVLGGFAGANIWVLIIVKTIIDISSHIQEHKKLEGKVSPTTETEQKVKEETIDISNHKKEGRRSLILNGIIVVIVGIVIFFHQHTLFDILFSQVDFTPQKEKEVRMEQTLQSTREMAISTSSRYPGCDTSDIKIGEFIIAACNIGANKAGTETEFYGSYLDRDEASSQCASGYHLPTKAEWQQVYTVGAFQNGAGIRNTLLLPGAGRSDGAGWTRDVAMFWLADRYDSAGHWNIQITSANFDPNGKHADSYKMSVRCFKDEEYSTNY